MKTNNQTICLVSDEINKVCGGTLTNFPGKPLHPKLAGNQAIQPAAAPAAPAPAAAVLPAVVPAAGAQPHVDPQPFFAAAPAVPALLAAMPLVVMPQNLNHYTA